YKCLIPEEVYEVFYEDAFELEEILKNMNVEILRTEKYVLKLLSSGRISLSYACELLDRSPYYIYELAREHEIELGSEESSFEKGQETLSDTL
ncbi:MAG: hypothetical protein ACP5PC_09770, partial [bacterium]